ncbi:MAG: flagellar motor protein MotB [Lachnospira sp.]|nr:flagellar motor protein MotB [Lachnospira sp.]
MARKPEEAPAGSPAWMTTFSDLMNLLLCFFVLLFSMSTVDAEKFQQIAASLSSTFSVLPSGGSAIKEDGILISSGASQLSNLSTYYNSVGLSEEGEISQEIEDAKTELEKEGLAESENMAEQIEGALEEKNLGDVIEVTATSKYVVLNMNGALLFDSSKAELKADAVSVIDRVADVLYVYDDHVIYIEGHTDNLPINTAKYPNNMMLSLYRAYSVYDYFVSKKGFDEATLTSLGKGDAVPIASNSTAEGRAQNRRVEIKIYNKLNS